MELETSNHEEDTLPRQDKPRTGKKSVFLYIMILFIAAFLLMALSFFMHQRSNTAALGALQNSVGVMQDLQATQEKIIILQEQLGISEARVESLESAAQEATAQVDALQQQSNALLALYTLQQEYAARHFDACQTLVTEMEAKGYPALLPTQAAEGVTPPNLRYQELRDAVEKQ